MKLVYIDRPRFRPNSLDAYLILAGAVAAAALLRLALGPWLAGVPRLAGAPFATFFVGVIAVTFLCGSIAGLAASLLSIAVAWQFIIEPSFGYVAIYQTLMFIVGSLTVCALVAVMRAVASDIRRLNAKLLMSEAQLRGLLDSAPDAMIITDERRRITFVNLRGESLFRFEQSEILGEPIDVLLAEPHRASYVAELDAFVTGARKLSPGAAIELDACRRDGGEFPVEVSLGLLRTANGILVSHAIRDIGARRETAARLAEASQAKSDFLARMSHELRTPLNAVIGFSEMIRDAAVGPLGARYREYGGDIVKAGQHLQNVINDILDISKVEGGRLELRDEIVSIAESVEGCRRIVAAMGERAEVAIAVELSASLPFLICDRLRFRQVLLNLMSNAVKFTPAGGSVTVSATVGPDGVAIAVADTGIGMRAEDIAIALEPFRQIEGTLSRRFDGTGLGLPLAKALVELHGGSLEIDSMPGDGTTVTILLPRERLAEVAA